MVLSQHGADDRRVLKALDRSRQLGAQGRALRRSALECEDEDTSDETEEDREHDAGSRSARQAWCTPSERSDGPVESYGQEQSDEQPGGEDPQAFEEHPCE